MDLQDIFNMTADAAMRERKNYQVTLGDLIDALKAADESAKLDERVVGISAYRGYYSDIALCTNEGQPAFRTAYDYDSSTEPWDEYLGKNQIDIYFSNDPKTLASELESIIGMHFDGYKGGYNQITRDKPLWLAEDYGDCSQVAVMGITPDLKLITKEVNN